MLKLAPTPVQLGLNRRGNRMNSSEMITPKADVKALKFADTAEFQERLRELPVFDYANYRSLTPWPKFPAALNPNLRIMESYKKRPQEAAGSKADKRKEIDGNNAQRNKPKKQLMGNIFFGPDFNAAAFTC